VLPGQSPAAPILLPEPGTVSRAVAAETASEALRPLAAPADSASTTPGPRPHRRTRRGRRKSRLDGMVTAKPPGCAACAPPARPAGHQQPAAWRAGRRRADRPACARRVFRGLVPAPHYQQGELNADAHHVHRRRRCHRARPGRARSRGRRHQARAAGPRADQAGATPDGQHDPAPARGVRPQPGSVGDHRPAARGTGPSTRSRPPTGPGTPGTDPSPLSARRGARRAAPPPPASRSASSRKRLVKRAQDASATSRTWRQGQEHDDPGRRPVRGM
jgi:hypothetical protein